MPILKTEILGLKIEINYEKKEYEKLLNLITKFKERLNEFPNDGKTKNYSIIILAALKVEDKLQEMQNLFNKTKVNKNTIVEQKINNEKLKKEIIQLKDELNNIKSLNVSNNHQSNKFIEEIDSLKSSLNLIQQKIKNIIK